MAIYRNGIEKMAEPIKNKFPCLPMGLVFIIATCGGLINIL